jgi:small-conductance mechanosensitive channel
MDLNGETLRWLLGRGAGLLIGTLALLLVYRVGVAAIHRLVPTVINAQAAHLPSGSSSDEEVGKRIRTIEDLLLKLLRMGVLAGFVVMALAVFELWGMLTAIAIVIVAIVFATRDVVLDYVMGFLILIEGPFFKGDYVAVSGHPGIEGVVEEIGLRRTLLRDAMGSSHAVSNGFIRLSSNLTRLFSVAVVDFHVPRAGDLDQALATAAHVADEMRADAVWADRFLEDAPTDIWVTGIGMDGASIRLQQRVPTGAQVAVASELRRRLAAALVAVSIGTGRWDTPMPIASQPSDPPRGG